MNKFQIENIMSNVHFDEHSNLTKRILSFKDEPINNYTDIIKCAVKFNKEIFMIKEYKFFGVSENVVPFKIDARKSYLTFNIDGMLGDKAIIAKISANNYELIISAEYEEDIKIYKNLDRNNLELLLGGLFQKGKIYDQKIAIQKDDEDNDEDYEDDNVQQNKNYLSCNNDKLIHIDNQYEGDDENIKSSHEIDIDDHIMVDNYNYRELNDEYNIDIIKLNYHDIFIIKNTDDKSVKCLVSNNSYDDALEGDNIKYIKSYNGLQYGDYSDEGYYNFVIPIDNLNNPIEFFKLL